MKYDDLMIKKNLVKIFLDHINPLITDIIKKQESYEDINAGISICIRKKYKLYFFQPKNSDRYKYCIKNKKDLDYVYVVLLKDYGGDIDYAYEITYAPTLFIIPENLNDLRNYIKSIIERLDKNFISQ